MRGVSKILSTTEMLTSLVVISQCIITVKGFLFSDFVLFSEPIQKPA